MDAELTAGVNKRPKSAPARRGRRDIATCEQQWLCSAIWGGVRECNHALALAVNDVEVDLIGLEGAPLHSALTSEPRVHSHRLSDRLFKSRASRGRTRFVWLSALRASRQAAGLFTMLMRLPKPGVILVQNPPAVPSSRPHGRPWMRGSRLIIDWHNLSYTMLAVRLGDGIAP